MSNRKKMESGASKIGIWISTEQRRKLEEQLKKHGTPISESVRRALDLYFTKLK
jgi:hypothetical protein